LCIPYPNPTPIASHRLAQGTAAPNFNRVSNPTHHTQGRGKHGGKLGALQLLRPVPIGVASHVALGERPLGLRDSAYTGLDLGRNGMLRYFGAASGGSACAVVHRLMAVARRGGAIGSPGTLRGCPLSLDHVMENDEDKRWASARAKEQTASGTICVHESSVWAAPARCKRPRTYRP
jgi:hypothetical protein